MMFWIIIMAALALVFYLCMWERNDADAAERDLLELARKFREEMDERATRSNVYPIRGRRVQGAPQRKPVKRNRDHA